MLQGSGTGSLLLYVYYVCTGPEEARVNIDRRGFENPRSIPTACHLLEALPDLIPCLCPLLSVTVTTVIGGQRRGVVSTEVRGSTNRELTPRIGRAHEALELRERPPLLGFHDTPPRPTGGGSLKLLDGSRTKSLEGSSAPCVRFMDAI